MLQHKNILAFIGGVLETKSFLITEYMERGNLSDVLKKEPNLPWTRKILMAIDAAEGINYLHDQDPVIVHRDLKSLNLLVNTDYVVKVADFGLSKATSGRSLNSKVGSVNWCAPEILRKRMPYTPKSDVYSFGMVLYEFITHHPPFQGLNPLQIVSAISMEDYPEIPANTLDELVQLTEDCWKTEPEDRPDFEEIIKRLHIIKTIFDENPENEKACEPTTSLREEAQSKLVAKDEVLQVSDEIEEILLAD
jgi:serine/threonine-protein kinase CTR1